MGYMIHLSSYKTRPGIWDRKYRITTLLNYGMHDGMRRKSGIEIVRHWLWIHFEWIQYCWDIAVLLMAWYNTQDRITSYLKCY